MSPGIRLKIVHGGIGEAHDAQVAVEEDRRDRGRAHQVLQVAVGLGELLHLAVHLLVDGRELLVDRLQLLAARLELLGGATQLLVHRLQLLVAGLQLLGRRFVLLHGVAQVALHLLELALEVLHQRIPAATRRSRLAGVRTLIAQRRTSPAGSPARSSLAGNTRCRPPALSPSTSRRARLGHGRLAVCAARNSSGRSSTRSAGCTSRSRFIGRLAARRTAGSGPRSPTGAGCRGRGRRAPRAARSARCSLKCSSLQRRALASRSRPRRAAGGEVGRLREACRGQHDRGARSLACPACRALLDLAQQERARARRAPAGRRGRGLACGRSGASCRRPRTAGCPPRPTPTSRGTACRSGFSAKWKMSSARCLRLAVEVDEQVAARDEVQPRERRVLQQVVRGEQHHLAQLAPHAVAAVLLDEEPPQPLLARRRRRSLPDRCRRAPPGSPPRRGRRRRPGWPAATSSVSRVLDAAAWRSNTPPRRWRRPAPTRARCRPGPCLRNSCGMRCLERLERLAVAEEIRDRDQQVLAAARRPRRDACAGTRGRRASSSTPLTCMRRAMRRRIVARL